MKKHVLLFLVFASLEGCVSMMAKANFTAFPQAKYAAKGVSETVEILATQPKREYDELGLISCRDTDNKWNLDQAVAKAREVGADAIIITKQDYLTGVTPFIGTPFNYGIEAVAIKYK